MWKKYYENLQSARTLNLLSTGSTQEDPSLYKWKIVDWM